MRDVALVVDAERRAAPEELRVWAQQPGAQRVERGDGDAGGAVVADERDEPHAHLVGGADGERQREDLLRSRAPAVEQGRDRRGQRPRLARARPAEDEQRAGAMGDGGELLSGRSYRWRCGSAGQRARARC